MEATGRAVSGENQPQETLKIESGNSVNSKDSNAIVVSLFSSLSPAQSSAVLKLKDKCTAEILEKKIKQFNVTITTIKGLINKLDRSENRQPIRTEEYTKLRISLENAVKEFKDILENTEDPFSNGFVQINELIELMTKKFEISTNQTTLASTYANKIDADLHVYFPFFIKGCFLEPILKISSEIIPEAILGDIASINKQWNNIENYADIEKERLTVNEEMHQQMCNSMVQSIDLIPELRKANGFFQQFTNKRANIFAEMKALGDESSSYLKFFVENKKKPEEIKTMQFLKILAQRRLPDPMDSKSSTNSNSTRFQQPTAGSEGRSSFAVKEFRDRKINYSGISLALENSSNNPNEHTVCKEITLFIVAVTLLVVGIAISRFNPES